jgi:hypothetical protein
MFITHHQEVFTVFVQQLVHVGTGSILNRPAASQLKPITRTNCCTYTVNTPDDGQLNMPETCRG